MGRRASHDWSVIDPKIKAMVAAGKSRREIWEALGLPRGTVNTRIDGLKLSTAGSPGKRAAKARAKAAVSGPAFDPPRGRMAALQYLPPSELAIDPAYQRSIAGADSQRLIKRIAAKWDWSLCLPLLVSVRENGGQLFVIDGQHRLEAARLRGDIGQLPCVIVSVGGVEGEAALFEQVNAQRRPLKSLELFRAAMASGDAEAQAIAQAIEAAKLAIAPHDNCTAWQPGMIGNIGGIRKAWQRYGGEATATALKVMAQAFDGQVLRYAGTIFPGIVAAVAQGRFVGLVALLAGKSQEFWRSAVLAARADDANLSFARASALVIERAWRGARGEGIGAASVDHRHLNALVPVDKSRFQEGYAWCEQCEKRVSAGAASRCASRFCKLKVAA